MSSNDDQITTLIGELNGALAWEMRAEVMYGHYAAYVRGIHRLHLKPFFEGEATESTAHGKTVREQIVALGGVATTDRDPTEIVHTTDYRLMLQEAFRTEQAAAATYKRILEMPGLRSEHHDAIEQIAFQEKHSIEELGQMLEQ